MERGIGEDVHESFLEIVVFLQIIESNIEIGVFSFVRYDIFLEKDKGVENNGDTIIFKIGYFCNDAWKYSIFSDKIIYF